MIVQKSWAPIHLSFGPTIQALISAKDGRNLIDPTLAGVRVNGASNYVSLAAIRVEGASRLARRRIGRDKVRISRYHGVRYTEPNRG